MLGEQFNVRIKLNSDEDIASVQCKLEFDKNKFEIVSTDTYSDVAKTILNEDLELVTADTEGNFIINTINGKKDKNEFELTFMVEENVDLKNEKIILKKIDSNIDIEVKNAYLLVGKQSKNYLYVVCMPIIILIICIYIKIKRRGGKK